MPRLFIATIVGIMAGEFLTAAGYTRLEIALMGFITLGSAMIGYNLAILMRKK